MFDQFYQFQGRPFQLTPDPHFYFESTTHRKALSYLGYGLAQGEGFIVITGDIGAGKTTLVGHLMETIDPARLTAVKLVSTQVGGDDILRMTAQNFGIASDGLTKAHLLQQIEAFLHTQARKGLRTLLIVDEAQNLAVSALEELRMLSNFQLGGQALLQIFLLGQPEFRDKLRSPELEQLVQRVIATHHLDPMLAQEVEPYIHHRLKLVGWRGNPRLTDDAFAAVYAATGGVPRRVNALMSRVLLLGAIDELAEIDGRIVQVVAADMGIEPDDVDADEDAFAPPPPVQAPVAQEEAAPVAAPVPAPEPVAPAVAYQPEPVAPFAAPFTPPEPMPVAMPEPVSDAGAARAMPSFVAPAFEAPSFEAPVETPVSAPAAPAPAFAPPVFEAPAFEAPAFVDPGPQFLVRDTADTSDMSDFASADFASEFAASAAPEAEAAPEPAPLPEPVGRDIVTAPAIDARAELLESRIAELEARLAFAEKRGDEQDEALRRVLTLLVNWVETGGEGHRAA